MSCGAPIGFVTQGGDCDNHDFNVLPGNVELYNGKNNDCNEQIDLGVFISWVMTKEA
jgi:hypothetical protein